MSLVLGTTSEELRQAQAAQKENDNDKKKEKEKDNPAAETAAAAAAATTTIYTSLNTLDMTDFASFDFLIRRPVLAIDGSSTKAQRWSELQESADLVLRGDSARHPATTCGRIDDGCWVGKFRQ